MCPVGYLLARWFKAYPCHPKFARRFALPYELAAVFNALDRWELECCR